MNETEAGAIADVLRKPLELNADAGDRILIITDTAMDEVLWRGLSTAATGLGMEPVVALMTPRETHSTDPVSPVRLAALDPGVDLCIYLTSTAMAHAPITEELIAANKRFILMEELTPAMLAPDGPAGADYDEMNRVGSALAEMFTEGGAVHVRDPNGTDLVARIDGRVGRAIAGRPIRLRPDGGGGCAFPDGETHVCPVEGTGEGVIVFDLTAHSVGLIEEPLRLTVEKGIVREIDGGREARIWRDILARFPDPNNYNCPAEIAVGLNPRVTPIGSMRTDKKLYGSAHIGMGDTVALGGTCHARLRLEGVIRHPEVMVDGRLMTRCGEILVG